MTTRMTAERLEQIEWLVSLASPDSFAGREGLELLAELREVTRERNESWKFYQRTGAYACLDLLKEYDAEGELNTLEALVIKALKERDKLRRERNEARAEWELAVRETAKQINLRGQAEQERDRSVGVKEMTNEFLRGYACALSCIVAGHGLGVEIEEALQAGGLNTKEKMREAGIDPYDMKILKPALDAIADKTMRRTK